jgi:hypothetical protein
VKTIVEQRIEARYDVWLELEAYRCGIFELVEVQRFKAHLRDTGPGRMALAQISLNESFEELLSPLTKLLDRILSRLTRRSA